jgi:formamidase
LVAGTTVYMPVYQEGALFSAGDAHFAQGDGEVCGTAIEMSATFRARFDIIEDGGIGRRGMSFEWQGVEPPPNLNLPARF